MASKKSSRANTFSSSSNSSHPRSVAKGDDAVFALLGTALPLLGYVITILAKKQTPYSVFYGKQGVVLFITGVAVLAAGWVLGLVPVIGDVLSGVLSFLFIILWVVGIVNALSGEARGLPFVGVYAGKI